MRITKQLIFGVLLPGLLISHEAYAASAKGKLSAVFPANYKIVAVNKDGSAAIAAVSSSGKFSVKVKRGATLQLVDASGRYKGPLVTAKGKKAYASLTGKSGNLGKFTLKSGFAVAKHNASTSPFFATKPSLPYNSISGPAGSNKFGFVQLQTSNSGSSDLNLKAEAVQEGQDSDSDGLPDLIDIDDDGDLKLDIVDEVPHKASEFQGETASTLRLDLVDSLNVNSGGISDALIDQLITKNLILRIGIRNNGTKTISSVNVDCQSLSYCSSAAGTATIRMDKGPLPEGALWVGYDPDADGLPNLQIVQDFLPATIGIRPRATREQLRTGDTILMNVKNSDNSTASVPAVLPFIFLTGPALKEFTDNAAVTSISYPVSSASPGASGLNPFVLSSGRVSMTFWKPQRKNIEGAEAEGYYDMGGLNYGVSLAVGSAVYTCQADEYSDLSGTLIKNTGAIPGTSVMRDTSLDAAATASNTLSYTIDIAGCLARQGVSTAGANVNMALEAVSDKHDSTSQFLYFKLP